MPQTRFYLLFNKVCEPQWSLHFIWLVRLTLNLPKVTLIQREKWWMRPQRDFIWALWSTSQSQAAMLLSWCIYTASRNTNDLNIDLNGNTYNDAYLTVHLHTAPPNLQLCFKSKNLVTLKHLYQCEDEAKRSKVLYCNSFFKAYWRKTAYDAALSIPDTSNKWRHRFCSPLWPNCPWVYCTLAQCKRKVRTREISPKGLPPETSQAIKLWQQLKVEEKPLKKRAHFVQVLTFWVIFFAL